MFVGHYAVAFALKGKEKGASLGALFIATQFVDILFFPFALLGIEVLNFQSGISEVNNLDLAHVPYTHGLLGSIIWAVLCYFLYVLFLKKGDLNAKKIGLVMAVGVLSHWFADLIAHTPDLPIISGEPKLGFGLWNNKEATFFTEAGLLVLSLIYYNKRTVAVNTFGKYASVGFVLFLILANYINFYVLPQEENLLNLTISALASYLLFAGLAWWIDKKRI
ncbi:hypothetical protein [Jiulongibacter sediminis]|jgi:hypothetical protein|uniref:hypothetical protein n=1 Tax=Jiulongibacter sediminis TaxID=1605367 RepID=UPI0026F312B8|nr:hypothetical protein [Jiulongibacter sediminis]